MKRSKILDGVVIRQFLHFSLQFHQLPTQLILLVTCFGRKIHFIKFLKKLFNKKFIFTRFFHESNNLIDVISSIFNIYLILYLFFKIFSKIFGRFRLTKIFIFFKNIQSPFVFLCYIFLFFSRELKFISNYINFNSSIDTDSFSDNFFFLYLSLLKFIKIYLEIPLRWRIYSWVNSGTYWNIIRTTSTGNSRGIIYWISDKWKLWFMIPNDSCNNLSFMNSNFQL